MAQQVVLCSDNSKLEELLSDSRFSLTLKPVDAEASHSQECIDAYIKGELKTCLEKMYTYNLLNKSKMNEDISSWYLLINCVEQLNDVRELGTTLQKTIGEWYTHEDSLRNLLRNLPLAKRLGTMYHFFSSSLKFWRQNLEKHYEHIDEIANSCNEMILQNSRNAKTQEEIEYLGKILEFLVLTVQIEILKKKPTVSMYTRFCELDDQLSHKLRSHSLTGHTTNIEKSIVNALQGSKQKKLPKKTNYTKHVLTKPPSHFPQHNLRSTSGLLHPSEKKQKNLLLYYKSVTLKNLQTLNTYIPHWLSTTTWSPHTILSLVFFILTLILPTFRRSKTFQIIWNNTSSKIMLLFRLSSAIIKALAAL